MSSENIPRIKLLYRGLADQTVWKPDIINQIALTKSQVSSLITLIDARFNDLFVGDSLEVPNNEEQAWEQAMTQLGVSNSFSSITVREFSMILRAEIAPTGTFDRLSQYIQNGFDNVSTNLNLVISWVNECRSMSLPDTSDALVHSVFDLIRGDASLRLGLCRNLLGQMTSTIQSNSDAIDVQASEFLIQLAALSAKIDAEKLALKNIIKQLSLATDAFSIDSSYETIIGRAILDDIITPRASEILQMADVDGTNVDDGPNQAGSPDVEILSPAPLPTPIIQPLPDYR